jgi:hypothetical protein
MPAAGADDVYYSRMTDEGYGLARAHSGLVMNPPRGLDVLHASVASEGNGLWVEVASRESHVARVPAVHAVWPVEAIDAEAPAVSSDAKWLAFLREGAHGRGSLWVRRRLPEGVDEAEVRLTDESYDVLDVAFVPGGQLVMAARRESRPELFLLGPDAGPIVRLPTSDARVRYPAASPDGRWLAYAAEEQGAWQLRLMDLATREERRFPHRDCNAITPTWSVDGARVIYASDCMRNVGNTALFERRVLP